MQRTLTHRRIAALIAVIDAMFYTITWFTIWALREHSSPLDLLKLLSKAMSQEPLPLFFSLIAICIVAWRGFADAERILVHRTSLIKLTLEGFLVTSLMPVAGFLIQLAPLAYAGTYEPMYESAKTWDLHDWASNIRDVLFFSPIFGILGALYGFVLGIGNRLLIKIFVNLKLKTNHRSEV